jgi:hypothetical protein
VRLPEPSPVDRYTLFVSSSNEPAARRLRQRIKTLVDDVISPQLNLEYPESCVAFYVDMWERTAAQKASGSSVNDQFVTRARSASLTLVLILDELRNGTKEELEAAVGEDGVEVSLLSFEPSRNADPRQRRRVERTIRQYQNTLLYARVGKPSSDEAWVAITRHLLAFVFAAMRKSAERQPDLSPTEVR